MLNSPQSQSDAGSFGDPSPEKLNSSQDQIDGQQESYSIPRLALLMVGTMTSATMAKPREVMIYPL